MLDTDQIKDCKNKPQKITIAIDGMAATGKGVLARRIASEYKLFALDSGKVFRLLALKLVENKLIDDDFSDDWDQSDNISKNHNSSQNLKKTNDKDKIIAYAYRGFFELFTNPNYNDLLDAKFKNRSNDIEKGQKKAITTKEQSFPLALLKDSKLNRPQIASFASILAKNHQIREIILEVLTKIIYHMQSIFNGVVIDGRDIGTKVAPLADYKFFLTADPFIRAKRRFLEQKKLGFYEKYDKKLMNQDNNAKEIDYTKLSITKLQIKELNKITNNIDKKHVLAIMKEIEARDIRDKTRNIAPCVPAKDAIIINTSDLSEDEVFSYAISKINQQQTHKNL